MSYNASSIDVLEFPLNIQKRPTMYIGSVDDFGKMVIYREPLDNSVDELLNGHGTKITTRIDSKKKTISIQDSGRGIPFDLHEKYNMSVMEVLACNMHAGGKFDKKSYQTSGGLNGIGLKCTNALSNFLIIESRREKAGLRMTFKKGIKVSEEKLKGSKETGTTITFQPSEDIFTEALKDFPEIHEFTEMLELRSFLNPGIEFSLEYDEQRFVYKADSIADFIDSKLSKEELLLPNHLVTSGKGDDKNVGSIDLAFNYSKQSLDENFYGFCNTIYQRDGGSHISGFKMAFCRVFQKYIKDSDLLKGKDKELELKSSDFFEGMYCIISIKHAEPLYSGQDKQKLNSSDASGAVISQVYSFLSEWVEQNANDAKRISFLAISSARNRIKNLKAKEASRAAVTGDSFAFNDKGKLTDCLSNEPEECELFVVEGESAGGTCKDGRDKENQAIFPLRGKCSNTYDYDINKVLAVKEFKDLINVIGVGIGKDADLSKLRYHKIIILPDADIDGAHISSLLMTFFWTHNRILIENGHVYTANPPLYRVVLGKNETFYVQTDSELNNYLNDKFVSSSKKLEYQFALKEGVTYKYVKNSKTIKDIIDLLVEYEKLVTKFEVEFGISTDIIDDLVNFSVIPENYEDLDEDELVEAFIEAFLNEESKVKQPHLTDTGHCSFIYSNDKSVANNTYCILLGGGDNNKVDNLFITRLYELISFIYESGINELKVFNGTTSISFISAIAAIERHGKSNMTISRFKGLGEMNPEQIWETTMDPITRTLTRLVVDDYSDEGETEKVMELFMSVKTKFPSLRREVMEKEFDNFDKGLLDV